TRALPPPRLALVVALPAPRPPAMRTGRALPVGMAGIHQPPLGLAGVDSAERWRGEGHEQPRMHRHRLGDTLAASQPSGQELEAVALVGRRARGAPRRPPVAACLEQSASGSRSVEYTVRTSPVEASACSTRPRSRTGCAQ